MEMPGTPHLPMGFGQPAAVCCVYGGLQFI
jgi:hypothetical protein